MSEWRIHWNIMDSGKEIVEAETEEEARKVFEGMSLIDLLGTNQNFAHIMQIAKVKEVSPWSDLTAK